MLENNYIRQPGLVLSWVDEIRYLGVYIVCDVKFRCSVGNGKRSFHRACNGILAKVGRLASEDVVVQLSKHKCLPISLNALEV